MIYLCVTCEKKRPGWCFTEVCLATTNERIANEWLNNVKKLDPKPVGFEYEVQSFVDGEDVISISQ